MINHASDQTVSIELIRRLLDLDGETVVSETRDSASPDRQIMAAEVVGTPHLTGEDVDSGQSEVEPVRGNRMHAHRRVTDRGQAPGDQAVGPYAHQGIEMPLTRETRVPSRSRPPSA